MTALELFDVLLIGALLVVAVAAVLVPRRAAATASFLVFGIVLAVLWARLGAPDVALAEAALGGGVAGALLVDALGRRDPPQARPVGRAPLVLGTLGAAAVSAGLLVGLRAVPADPSPLVGRAYAELAGTGVENPVTAVLLNYRSFDTLLEIAVLAIAAYGAGAVVRVPVRRLPPADVARRGLATVLLPVVLLLAVWLLVAGTSRPGGAFQSGALLGAALVIAHLCGMPFATPRGRGGAAWIMGGLLAFVLLAVCGLLLTGTWLGLDPAWATAAILAVETALALSIGVGLAMIFTAARADETATRWEVGV